MSWACCTSPTWPGCSSRGAGHASPVDPRPVRRTGPAQPRVTSVPVPQQTATTDPAVPAHRGPFRPGDRVQLTDPKGRMHTIVLEPGRSFHTHRGALEHDDLLGLPDGSVVTSSGGTAYLA